MLDRLPDPPMSDAQALCYNLQRATRSATDLAVARREAWIGRDGKVSVADQIRSALPEPVPVSRLGRAPQVPSHKLRVRVTQVGRSAYRRPDGIMGICVGHTSGAYGRSLCGS